MTSNAPPAPAVTVVGSINCDLSFFVRALPRRHETVQASDFGLGTGGKGLNQAVAAQSAGARTAMIGCIGDDLFGDAARRFAARCGLALGGLKTVSGTPTGTAAIIVNEAGENMIVVSPGANAQLVEADINAHSALIENAAILVTQLEVPVQTVSAALRMAKLAGVRTLLNPAPALPEAKALLPLADIVTPNETEAQSLTGILPGDASSAGAAAQALCGLGAGAVVITMGAQGHYVYEDGQGALFPASPVKAVDATGAGDVFTGVLARMLADGSALTDAAHTAAAAAALSVTSPGAQGAAPDWDSIQNMLEYPY